MKLFTLLAAAFCALPMMAQSIVHPSIGVKAASADGSVRLELVGKRQNFGGTADTRDAYINSPKSANIHPSGKKYYINSLEGGTTVVFEMGTNRRLKVIKHQFTDADAGLWSEPSSFYPFTHYAKNNSFMGKPVESTFSHGGRYLWVPYYRRSYDINAQDPSAVAIIDTETDEIVRLMETGPLPKMIATSHDGKTVAIAHWGNNTVGLIDITGGDPTQWHHKACLTVDYVLPLNYPTNRSVDRDNGSGYALRGTVFTPDDHYLLVGCMGGGGGIAVIDLAQGKYLGRVLGMMSNVRHLVIKGDYLYLSINGGGYVQRIPLKTFMEAVGKMQNERVTLSSGWENCKVGTGARTIELSPSGRYCFAACNNVSRLCVVDTRTMTKIAEIPVDSYPVGLDISEDGQYVIVTSQGRSNGGGNAVNIYRVEYAEPEKPLAGEKTIAYDSTGIAADTLAVAANEVKGDSSEGGFPTWGAWCLAGGGVLCLCAYGFYRYRS